MTDDGDAQMDKGRVEGGLPTHGANSLPSVTVDSYNLEIEDDEGFIGDKASHRAFRRALEEARTILRSNGVDPLGEHKSEDISKKKLEALLVKGDAEAAAVVQTAIESFAAQLANVIKRFMRQKSWRDTECIVFGGGFRNGRIGELSIARTAILLKEAEVDVNFDLLHNHPDEAGLIGAAHLLPPWMIQGHDAIVAVDVGGTNIRTGIVHLGKKADLSAASVHEMTLWRYGDDDDLDREDAVSGLCRMIKSLIKSSEKDKLRLAPVIGIGCPGVIRDDGGIERGAQNLPGNWESSRFNLPKEIQAEIPTIGEHETMVVMHNDAVVQGLSELPHMQEYERWAVLTIGTGLGNARFSMRRAKPAA